MKIIILEIPIRGGRRTWHQRLRQFPHRQLIAVPPNPQMLDEGRENRVALGVRFLEHDLCHASIGITDP